VTLREVARIRLPPHRSEGGFDHAAVHRGTGRLFVAHTSNDSVDIVDLATRQFRGSIPGLRGVAGVWVAETPALLFTSNRGEDTASVFDVRDQVERFRVPTGHRPNGMALDTDRLQLLVAGVGNKDTGAPASATVIDVTEGRQLAQFSLPGRTRWCVYNRASDSFFVNIGDPPGIVQIDASKPTGVSRFIGLPGIGPHGLEQGGKGNTLYSICDDGRVLTVELPSGDVGTAGRLSGAPDVAWINHGLGRLYVAVPDPGVVDVFQTRPFRRLESVPSGEGAHTLTVDPSANEVHVFLPRTHEDLVLCDA
jgi:DNA-binding beta-propeller fold protein YncE